MVEDGIMKHLFSSYILIVQNFTQKMVAWNIEHVSELFFCVKLITNEQKINFITFLFGIYFCKISKIFFHILSIF